MSSLQVDDFAEFFREVNDGYTPFPWQERLARKVCNSGEWHKCLDLPTGTGKTAVLEIAIFHLALEARRLAERRAPVRIAFVVDRRLIVDQAHDRAVKIQKLLVPGDTAAGRVARELEFLGGAGNPLVVEKLRGGMPRETDWARTPVQPTILLSTVDQVGSRLLFRGYGVSKSMRPVHAGLLGSDCLIFLDEAHLSEPFRQSLGWIERYRNPPWCESKPAPWAMVSMSATPESSSGDRFTLDPDTDLKSEILRKRLEASKMAELREIPGANLASTYADAARKFAEEENINRVLIVVNRVDLARAIFEEIKQENALLLTGRVREIDREKIVRKIEERLKEPDRKLFVVATQCVETGADYDFDALVTQVAPLDALRQRFGRLNRTGRDIESKAVILAAKEDLPSKKPDPIYEFDAKKTWDVLKKIARPEGKRLIVDFGSLALSQALTPGDIAATRGEILNAPVMPPAYVDLWTYTNPPPSVEPEVALFLHGPERATADVEIVWRSDIEPKDLDNLERLKELLDLVPPRPAETLSVPIWKARDWLSGDSKMAARVGDLEGERESEEGDSWRARPVLRWSGADDNRTKIILSHEIRPADVIVVPAIYGGCDEWGWTGKNDPAVKDVADEAAALLRPKKIAVRLHPSLFKEEVWSGIRGLVEEFDDPARLREDLLQYDIESLTAMTRNIEATFFYQGDDNPAGGLILTGRREMGRRERPTAAEVGTEDDKSGCFGSRAELATHCEAVRKKAVEFATQAGVNGLILKALEFAAELHDSGKGDRRFQKYLRNGNGGPEILAKSNRRHLGPAGEKRARESAGLPEHWRHEALSVRIAIEDPRFRSSNGAMDEELALWLIGTHHGHGRPFFPHDDPADDSRREINGSKGETLTLDASAGPQRLDFDWNGLDWVGLFDVVRRRYGAWELARLEAFLRLADHRASEEGDV